MEMEDNNLKTCRKCHSEINAEASKCPICKSYQTMPIWGIILIVIAGIVLVAIISQTIINNSYFNNTKSNILNSNNNNPTKNHDIQSDSSDNNIIMPSKKIYGLDESFVFDNLEITINSNYSFEIVKNRYSDYNNHPVIKLPITVKNISNATHSLNMFYYNVYGSKGVEIKTLGSYFDNDIDTAGNLRSNASYTKFLYFEYDGDGKYAIEFDNYSSELSVEFDIVKN